MLKHIDTTMTEVYWYVGKITYELSNNSTKASYGKQIIDALSSRLTNEFGSGFSPVSIRRMRKFYEIYPIWSAVPTELSWSHFQELIRVDRKEERKFYENEAIKFNWGYRELRRQINTKLYDRYLISPDKNKILLFRLDKRRGDRQEGEGGERRECLLGNDQLSSASTKMEQQCMNPNRSSVCLSSNSRTFMNIRMSDHS